MWVFDYFLWRETDNVGRAGGLCSRGAPTVDIVGVNYSRRCSPTAPTAARFVTDDPDQDTDNLVYTTKEKYEDDVLEEVSHLGFAIGRASCRESVCQSV